MAELGLRLCQHDCCLSHREQRRGGKGRKREESKRGGPSGAEGQSSSSVAVAYPGTENEEGKSPWP